MRLRISGDTSSRRLNNWQTQKANLFSVLQRQVSNLVSLPNDSLQQDLATWREFFDSVPDPKRRTQLLEEFQLAEAMVWCACESQKERPAVADAIQRVLNRLASKPDFIAGREGWALACIRLFQNPD